jgi:hypothetical protein
LSEILRYLIELSKPLIPVIADVADGVGECCAPDCCPKSKRYLCREGGLEAKGAPDLRRFPNTVVQVVEVVLVLATDGMQGTT